MRQLLKDLNSLRELLKPEGRWCQGFYAFGADKQRRQPNDQDAVCWCLIGGCKKIARDDGLWSENKRVSDMVGALVRSLPKSSGVSVAGYNDSRKKPAIMNLITKAIKVEEEKSHAK